MLTQDEKELVLEIASMYLGNLELFGGNKMESLSYSIHVNEEMYIYKEQLFLLETIFTLRHLLLEKSKETIKEKELEDEHFWECKLNLKYMEFSLPKRHYQKDIESLLLHEVF